MTEEQIKQNAEAYASELVERDYHEDMWLDLYDAHEAGAHSRDEEVEELKEEIESIKEYEKELFDGFMKLGTKLGELMKENVKLRNPWRETKKDPPEALVEVIGYWPSWDGSISKCAYSADVKLWFMDMILCEEPDFWMPIPETPKGGEV